MTDKPMLYMGLVSNNIVKPGESFIAVGRPQIPFQPEGVMVPRHLAEDFLIDSIQIGNRAELSVQWGPVSAELFEVSIDNLVDFITFNRPDGVVLNINVNRRVKLIHGRVWAFGAMYPGQDFVVRGTNISAYPHLFRMAVVGHSPGDYPS